MFSRPDLPRLDRMRIVTFITICGLAALAAVAQMPVPSSGSLKRIEQFKSKFVDARNVDVWLPAGYKSSKKYAVLYMHDGQMLFDAATTWNKQEWKVDEVAGKLIGERSVADFIVVGIWNNGEYRHSEYFPEKALGFLPPETREAIIKVYLKGKPRADDYLRFITSELKPFIDKTFSTRKDINNTFIMGSSMGGLISIYALCEYPDVFGGAAGISTHLPLISTAPTDLDVNLIAASFRTYLDQSLPKGNTRRIYFDHGDQTLDALYPPLQKKLDAVMTARNYTKKNWVTRAFPGADHSEVSWAKRLDIPIRFLMGK